MKGCVAYTALLFLVPCMGQNMVSLDSGNFNASWTFNETSDTFEFLVDVRATGWVGFGFSLNPPPGMMNYDVAVGGVLSNGSAYLQDYYTREQSRPTPEQNQDFMLINATEQNQVTTLAFSRKRNTTDPEDIAIQRGMPVFLVWAYHRSSDAFLKHEVKGVQPEVVILPSLQTTPLPTQPTMPAPKMFQRNTSFDGGNFNVYWSYNSTSDRLYFTLDVAATGWVGFGFSENMPSAMNGYDVVVGGVRNGDMYLKDYSTQGFGFPPEDQQQNVDLMYATERDGRTMISYSRKRDTNDTDDIAIAIGEMYYLVWAYHSTDDGTVKHQQEGFAKMVVIPADDAVSTTDGVGPGAGVEQGGEMDQDEKETDLLLTITILLAVTLGLIVVSLFLVALGLAYFKSLMQRVAVAK
ncbi:uncharacterized protein [Montipora foliosa]|uniref:uncharacterized protein n=1 Tax=Montipora foliosa TaxID=591990 RepID=UPI0035F1E4FC